MRRLRMSLCLSMARSFLLAASLIESAESQAERDYVVSCAKAQIAKYYRLKAGELL